MKTKHAKVYTLAQVKKLLRKGNTTIYKYVEAGLIKVSPDKVAMKSGERPVMVVSEAEYERLKRNGVDSTGIKAKTAKKPPKRSTTAAVATAKKRIKRKAAAATAKTQVNRPAAAAPRTAKRSTSGKAAKKAKRSKE
jgi:hypothetical protein